MISEVAAPPTGKTVTVRHQEVVTFDYDSPAAILPNQYGSGEFAVTRMTVEWTKTDTLAWRCVGGGCRGPKVKKDGSASQVEGSERWHASVRAQHEAIPDWARTYFTPPSEESTP